MFSFDGNASSVKRSSSRCIICYRKFYFLSFANGLFVLLIKNFKLFGRNAKNKGGLYFVNLNDHNEK